MKSRGLAWIGQVSLSVAAMGLTALATFGAGVLLARHLPPEQLGAYALLVSAAGTISVIGSLGQPTLLVRIYSRGNSGDYDWPRDLMAGMRYTGLPLILLVVGTVLLYQLTWTDGFWLFGFTVSAVILLFLGQILIAHRSYAAGNAMPRLPNALILLPLIGLASIGEELSFVEVVLWRLVCGLVVAVCGALLLYRGFERGSARMSMVERSQGYPYLLLVIAALLVGDGVVMLAALALSPAELGAFAALMVLLRPWYLGSQALVQIVRVEIARRASWWGRAEWVALAAGTGLGGIGAAFGFPWLINVLFQGQYDAYALLGWPIVLTGSALVLDAPARGAVMARGLPELVRHFSWLHSGLAIAGAGGILVCGVIFGIGALTWSLCIYALIRCVGTLGICWLVLPRQSVRGDNDSDVRPADDLLVNQGAPKSL